MKLWLKITLILSLLFCPLVVEASSEPTKDFYSYIEVQEDGSIKVREMINLSGKYNGFTRDIDYRNASASIFQGQVEDLEGSDIYNGSMITDIKVGGISNQNLSFDSISKDIDYFSEVMSASNGQAQVYTIYHTGNGVSLKVYHPSSYQQAFYIEYIIKDAVVVHNDIAELAWNVLGDGYQENIGNFQIKVVLPGKDSDARVWLKGPLNGEVERLDDGAHATYSFLGAYNAVSIRLLFDKSMVSGATKFSHMEAKEDIIAIETKAAELANQERERIRRQNRMIVTLSYLWLIVAIILTVFVFSKAKKSKKTSFQMQYYREFPGDYGPEVLQYLVDKKIDEKSLSATILNLVYKKVLTVEEVEGRKKDYKLVLQENNNQSLTEVEQMAIKLLIGEVGNGVILSELKKYCSSLTQAQDFMEQYNKFITKAKKNGKQEEFYQTLPGIAMIAMIVSIAGIFISVLGLAFEVDSLICFISGIIGGGLALLIATRRFFTPKGAEHYAKWMAHKQFLKDFSRFDEKELPEVVLWDKYLVYATVLGCADELSKQMQLKINTMEESGVLVGGYDPLLHHYMLHSAIYSSINRDIHSAVSSSRSSIAASSASSGGGFGGGASGGGGSFGGGGGGGRF